MYDIIQNDSKFDCTEITRFASSSYKRIQAIETLKKAKQDVKDIENNILKEEYSFIKVTESVHK